MVRLLAWGGDLMKLCGHHEPPLSSFRLRNMRADTTGVPLEPTERITGSLPYSLEQGVDLRKHKKFRALFPKQPKELTSAWFFFFWAR